MPRPAIEVADILRGLGPALRDGLSRDQHKAVNAILACRTAQLGGHVTRCQDCAAMEVAYNSCRNRHCPKCQSAASHDWLEARRRDLLPVAYYHVVFTRAWAYHETRDRVIATAAGAFALNDPTQWKSGLSAHMKSDGSPA